MKGLARNELSFRGSYDIFDLLHISSYITGIGKLIILYTRFLPFQRPFYPIREEFLKVTTAGALSHYRINKAQMLVGESKSNEGQKRKH